LKKREILLNFYYYYKFNQLARKKGNPSPVSRLFPVPDKTADGTVKGSFNRIRKIAGRKLAVFPVIMETLTAEPFSFAGIVRAVASGQIFLDIGTVFAHGSVIRHKVPSLHWY